MLCCLYVCVYVCVFVGLFRLALLLSQADGDEDLGYLVRQQLSLWGETGADDQAHMPREILGTLDTCCLYCFFFVYFSTASPLSNLLSISLSVYGCLDDMMLRYFVLWYVQTSTGYSALSPLVWAPTTSFTPTARS